MTEAPAIPLAQGAGRADRDGRPVAEIETDKAIAELEAPAAGVLGRHQFAIGEVVPVGVALAMILGDGESEDPVADRVAAAVGVVVGTDHDLPLESSRAPVVAAGPSVVDERPRHRASPRQRAAALRAAAQAGPVAVAASASATTAGRYGASSPSGCSNRAGDPAFRRNPRDPGRRAPRGPRRPHPAGRPCAQRDRPARPGAGPRAPGHGPDASRRRRPRRRHAGRGADPRPSRRAGAPRSTSSLRPAPRPSSEPASAVS